ncbi:MAG: hypothetical protein ACHQF2_03060 [Flavobacteriales bacterium]
MKKNFFDELSKNAYAQGAGVPELNELWGNTFLLNEWFFIGRGPLDHPYPYIASRPDTCEGKNMIRAFTDSDKLTLFAKENDLLETDKSVRILSIPTVNIISWLEGFAQHNVHGVWFNSDTSSSYGYFAPILQLQSIKDYLDKTWTRNPGNN